MNIKDLAEAKGTSAPVREALLALEAKVMMLEHDLAEERDRIVSIPPLGQSILDACEGGERKRSVPRDRHRQVVDDMQHRDGDDEREVEPVRDVDVRFGPARQRANEDDQIGHPNDG